jgi:hypothetical protein
MTYSPSQEEIINIARRRLQAKAQPFHGRVAKSLFEALPVESNFTDLPGGDLDSTGVLQQRNNGAWGHGHEDPGTDIDQYIEAAIKANQGFSGSAGQLAQTVQQSRYPRRYDEHAAEAARLLHQGSSSAPVATNMQRIASTPTSVPGVSQDVPKQPTVYDVIASYRANTAPSAPPVAGSQGISSPYDPVASGQQIQQTVDRIKALRAPAQSAMQTGDAHATGIAGNSDAPAAVAQLIEEADKINAQHMPYVWGGGHAVSGKADRGTGRDPGIGLDCSGAVSAVLDIDPRVSGDFMKWGQAGEGKNVTVYANGHHVLMKINGHFFGTSGSNPRGGAGWIPQRAISPGYLKNFTVRHPKGM